MHAARSMALAARGAQDALHCMWLESNQARRTVCLARRAPSLPFVGFYGLYFIWPVGRRSSGYHASRVKHESIYS